MRGARSAFFVGVMEEVSRVQYGERCTRKEMLYTDASGLKMK